MAVTHEARSPCRCSARASAALVDAHLVFAFRRDIVFGLCCGRLSICGHNLGDNCADEAQGGFPGPGHELPHRCPITRPAGVLDRESARGAAVPESRRDGGARPGCTLTW